MVEYIEREAARNALYDADAITMEGVRILNRFPAADVKPVVRGKWERRNWGFDYDCCSVCGYEHRYSGPFHYCPNCGAKMVGDTGEDEEETTTEPYDLLYEEGGDNLR